MTDPHAELRPKSNAERLLEFIESAIDRERDLGVIDVGRIMSDDSDNGELTLGVSYDNGEYVYVTVELG